MLVEVPVEVGRPTPVLTAASLLRRAGTMAATQLPREARLPGARAGILAGK